MALLLALAIVLGTAGQDPRPQPRDPVKKGADSALTASISGRITDVESGRPLPDAEVVAIPLNPFGSDGRPRMYRTVADHGGRYIIRDIPPGDYRITASPGALRGTHGPGAYGVPSRIPGSDLSVPPVRLRARDALTGIDIVLPRAYAIEGRVVNERGQPLGAISINAERVDGWGGFSRERQTDDRGYFRIYGLLPGQYRICAHPQSFGARAEVVGGSTARYGRTCHPSGASAADGTTLVVADRDVHVADIQLARSGTFTIAGEIVGAGGAAVVGGSVDVLRREGSTSRGMQAEVTGSRFVVRGALPGEYRLHASAGPGHGFATVTVAASDLVGLQIPISPGAEVHGRVVTDGAALPADAQRRLRVAAVPVPLAGSRSQFGHQEPVALDAERRFVLRTIFDPVRITAVALPSGWAVLRVTHLERDITDRPAMFDGRSAPDAVQIVLTNRTAKLTVRTLDAQGQPAAALVLGFPAERERRPGGMLWGRETAAGVYDLGSLPPGDYLVTALTSMDALRPLNGELDPDRLLTGAQPVTIREHDHRTVDIRIVPGGGQ